MIIQKSYDNFVRHANDKGPWEPSYRNFFEAGYRTAWEQLQEEIEAVIYPPDDDGFPACGGCFARPGLPHDEDCNYIKIVKVLEGALS